MNIIVDPNTHKKYSLFSKQGKNILKHYIIKFNGGSDTDTATATSSTATSATATSSTPTTASSTPTSQNKQSLGQFSEYVYQNKEHYPYGYLQGLLERFEGPGNVIKEFARFNKQEFKERFTRKKGIIGYLIWTIKNLEEILRSTTYLYADEKVKKNIAVHAMLISILKKKIETYIGIDFNKLNKDKYKDQFSKHYNDIREDKEVKNMLNNLDSAFYQLGWGYSEFLDEDDSVSSSRKPPFFDFDDEKKLELYKEAQQFAISEKLITDDDKFQIDTRNIYDNMKSRGIEPKLIPKE